MAWQWPERANVAAQFVPAVEEDEFYSCLQFFCFFFTFEIKYHLEYRMNSGDRIKFYPWEL